MFSSPFINNDNTSMVRLWLHINMVKIVTKTQSDSDNRTLECCAKSSDRPFITTWFSSIHRTFTISFPTTPPPHQKYRASLVHYLSEMCPQGIMVALFISVLDICFDECSYHNSLQAPLRGNRPFSMY